MQLPQAAPEQDDAIPEPETPGQIVSAMRDHREAPLSATARLVDRNGVEWLITVRAGADGKAFVAFLDVLGAAGSHALAHGFGLTGARPVPPPTPAPAVAPAPAATPAAAAPASPPPAAHTAAQPAHPANGEQTYACTELAATITNGRTLWRVKGGSFGQYGVTVWPEVLEAAGLTDLEPEKAYDLQGWQATWIADAQGRKKVVRLAQLP